MPKLRYSESSSNEEDDHLNGGGGSDTDITSRAGGLHHNEVGRQSDIR